MNKKVKLADGTVKEVPTDYKLQQGEEFFEETLEAPNITEQLKPVVETLAAAVADNSKANKETLTQILNQVKETETKLNAEIAKFIQTPKKEKQELLSAEYFINHRTKTGHFHKDDPVYRFAVGLGMWNKGQYDQAVREGYIKLATTDIMGTDTAALGGALVPTGFELEARAEFGKYSLYAQLVQPRQTSFQSVKMARRTSASTTYIQAEKVASTRSKPATESKTVYVELVTTAIESSRQLLEDTESLLQFLQMDAMDSRGKFFDTQWLTGSGYSAGTTLCTGLSLVSDAQNPVTRAPASLTFDDINSMVTKLSPRSRPTAAFIWHPDVMGVIRQIKDSNNRPIFQEYIGMGSNDINIMGRLMGIPVYESYALPGLDAAADTAYGVLADVARVTKARYKLGMSVEPVFYGVNADAVDLQSAYEFKMYVRERHGLENFADLDVDGENHQIVVAKTAA